MNESSHCGGREIKCRTTEGVRETCDAGFETVVSV